MLFLSLTCLSFLTTVLAVTTPHTSSSLLSRAQSNPNPTVSGNADAGWQFFPDVVDATGYPDWVVEEERNIKMVQVFFLGVFCTL